MAYQKQIWRDLPDETTPLSAERLNHMEQGIFDASQDEPIATQDTAGIVKPSADMSVSEDGTLNIGDTIARQANLSNYLYMPVAPQIEAGTNLDNLPAGVVSVLSNTVAESLINYPFGVRGGTRIETYYTNVDTRKLQIASSHVEKDIKLRWFDGVWSEWDSIALKSTIDFYEEGNLTAHGYINNFATYKKSGNLLFVQGLFVVTNELQSGVGFLFFPSIKGSVGLLIRDKNGKGVQCVANGNHITNSETLPAGTYDINFVARLA